MIGRLPSGGTRSYYHTDLLGSTRAVVQGATVTESYDYDPWGVLMPGRALGSGAKEQFTTKERDAESQLDYFGARYYASAIGRWTSVDPAVAADAMPEWSTFAYARNEPLGRVDPDGRCPIPQLCIAAAVAVGTAIGAAAYQVYQNSASGRPLSENLGLATVRGLRDGAVGALIGFGMTAAAERVLAASAAASSGAEATSAVRGGRGPVLKGQAGVQRAIREYESQGGTVLGEQITLRTPAGRTVPDFYGQNANGIREFVEVKNGPYAALTANQRSIFPIVSTQGAIPVGANAEAAGLQPGVPIPPTPVRVFRYP